MSTTTVRGSAARAQATREAILDAAERLFAEHGVDRVSHRQISAAAGQGNNAAVGYHFGTTDELISAIVERHVRPMDELRSRMVEKIEGSTDVRDWVDCLVRPSVEHLEALGHSSWYARLSAQLSTDPRRHPLVVERHMTSEPLRRTVAGFEAALPDLPDQVRRERSDMARILMVHVFAEREAALAEGRPTARASWSECADGLVDALVGLWTAPVRS